MALKKATDRTSTGHLSKTEHSRDDHQKNLKTKGEKEGNLKKHPLDTYQNDRTFQKDAIQETQEKKGAN